MVDMKTQGDSLYDIVDKRDHSTVQAQLLQGASVDPKDVPDVSFFCRMNMSRTLKRQSGFGDVKVMHVRGHFVQVNNDDDGATVASPGDSQCVFMASCSPLITPDVKENLVQNNTMVFKTVHQLDMTYVEVTKLAEYHLGYSSEEMSQKSWYSMIHPEDIHEAKEKHTQLIRSNHEMGCMMTVRMLKADGSIFWLNVVMHVRQASLTHCDEPYIVCINQIISAQEAYQIKMQGQMFSMYPNRVQELWGNQVANVPTSLQGQSGTQWIQQNGGENTIPMSAYQTGPTCSAEQPEFQPVYSGALCLVAMPGHNRFGKANNVTGSSDVNGPQHKIPSLVQTDTLKAMLKRKIQGPTRSSGSCRPVKSAKMLWNLNGMSDGQDYGDMEHFIYHDDHYNGTDRGGGNMPADDCHSQSVQVLLPSSYRTGVHMAKKAHMAFEVQDKSFHFTPSRSSKMSLEQVVPNMNVPESYLTPDPSPVSSPEPSHVTIKTEVMDSEEMANVGKSSVSILQALEKLVSLPQENVVPQCKPPRLRVPPCAQYQENQNRGCKKELPIFDAFDIDSFFDTLDIPQLRSKASVKVVDEVKVKQEIKSEIPCSSQTHDAKEYLCLPVLKKEVACLSPPTTFSICRVSSDSIAESLPVFQAKDAVMLSESNLPKLDFEELSESAAKTKTSVLRKKDLVVSSTMIRSPGSVGLLDMSSGAESFDGLLSCFSDVGLDLSPLQTDPRSTILDSSMSESMLAEQFERAPHEKTFATTVSCKTSSVSYRSLQTSEELSPHSSISSLAGEDEMIDSPPSWSLEMALGVAQPQDRTVIGSRCSIKDRDVLGMESGFPQLDLFFSS